MNSALPPPGRRNRDGLLFNSPPTDGWSGWMDWSFIDTHATQTLELRVGLRLAVVRSGVVWALFWPTLGRLLDRSTDAVVAMGFHPFAQAGDTRGTRERERCAGSII